jgi:hypothetical protein
MAFLTVWGLRSGFRRYRRGGPNQSLLKRSIESLSIRSHLTACGPREFAYRDGVDSTGRGAAKLVGLLTLGFLIALIGTGVHRMAPPWGLVMALAGVMLGGILARAAAGLSGVIALGLGVAAGTWLLAIQGPGGDVLVADDVLGRVWYFGAFAAVLAFCTPRSWFVEHRDAVDDSPFTQEPR